MKTKYLTRTGIEEEIINFARSKKEIIGILYLLENFLQTQIKTDF